MSAAYRILDSLTRRRRNPPRAPLELAQEFLERLGAARVVLKVSESELRGMAAELGLDEIEEAAFLENASTWLARGRR